MPDSNSTVRAGNLAVMKIFHFQGLNDLRKNDFMSLMSELDGLKVPTSTEMNILGGDS